MPEWFSKDDLMQKMLLVMLVNIAYLDLHLLVTAARSCLLWPKELLNAKESNKFCRWLCCLIPWHDPSTSYRMLVFGVVM